MDKAELVQCLQELRLTPREAGALLGVDPKTVGRWLTGVIAVSGPAEQALLAWRRLERRRLPWRPDGLPLMSPSEMEEQVRLMREHVIVLDDVLERVRQRGGPRMPWAVDLKSCRAELTDRMHVHFYALPNGGFSVGSYRRTDKAPEYARDLPLIEDAIACIADAIEAERKAGRNWIEER
ncbi:MAG TPA: hypothetical protein VMB83_07935 [Roseiarcus sp.]|nr:hypothetical protein [Roseiarcus sp.]